MGDTPNPVELFGGPMFMRSYPLEDIHVKPGSDGRTVEAYAAVFDVEAEIQDFEGHYNEVIDRSAFDKVLSRAQQSDGSWRVGVFYNHGMTLHGTPSDRGAVPIGTPELIRTDARGLLTVTRYNKTEQAEDILEAIRSGGITAQSFTGRIMRSDPTLSRADRRRGGYLPVNGRLQTVRRMELGLVEYGPTPMPAYADAAIMGVRMLNPFSTSDEDQAETPDESELEAVAEVATTDPFRRRIHAAMRARGL
jgi:HK97 family phage prohead protease